MVYTALVVFRHTMKRRRRQNDDGGHTRIMSNPTDRDNYAISQLQDDYTSADNEEDNIEKEPNEVDQIVPRNTWPLHLSRSGVIKKLKGGQQAYLDELGRIYVFMSSLLPKGAKERDGQQVVTIWLPTKRPGPFVINEKNDNIAVGDTLEFPELDEPIALFDYYHHNDDMSNPVMEIVIDEYPEKIKMSTRTTSAHFH